MLGEWHFILVVAAHALIAIELQTVAQLAFGIEDGDLSPVGVNGLQVLRDRPRGVKVVDARTVNAQQYPDADQDRDQRDSLEEAVPGPPQCEIDAGKSGESDQCSERCGAGR